MFCFDLFQLRDIGNEPLTFAEHKTLLQSLHPNVPNEFIENLLSFSSLVNSNDLETLKLIHFPLDRLDLAVQLVESVPKISMNECLHRIYPSEILYRNNVESKKAIELMWKKLAVRTKNDASTKKIIKIDRQDTRATVHYQIDGENQQIDVKNIEFFWLFDDFFFLFRLSRIRMFQHRFQRQRLSVRRITNNC